MSTVTRQRRNLSLVGAAARLDRVASTPEWERQLRRHEKWQASAWAYYDHVGEVHYAVGQISDALARANLFVGARPEPNAPLVPADDEDSGIPADVAALAMASLEKLKSPVGGQAQIIRQATAATLVTGEWYLVEAETAEAGVAWYVRTTEDVKVENGRVKVDPFGVLDPQQVSRVWVPHPRRFEAADSGMRAVLDQCETVLLIDRQFRASLRSRLFAGLLLLPNTLRQGASDPASEEAGDGEGTDDPVVEDMVEALSTAIQNEGSAAAVVPNTLWGEGDQLQHARLLDLGKQVDPELVKLRESCLRRVAQGLDIPPEIVLGVADLNHWSTWWVGESFTQHVEPKAAFLADAFTSVFLRPDLEAAGLAEWSERLEVGFDLSPLQKRPNADEDAKYAYDKGELSGEGLRRILRIPESDAPDDDERLVNAALKRGQITPDLTSSILEAELETEWEPPENPGGKGTTPTPVNAPPAEEPPPEEEGPPAEGAPEAQAASAAENPGSGLAAIDIRLSERLFASSLAAFRRSLEKAGNRAKAKVAAGHRPALSGVAPQHIVRQLGPTLLAAAGLTEDELLTGALDNLRTDFDRWTDEAQAAALATAVAAAGREPSANVLAELRGRQNEDRADAWEWFSLAALALLTTRMTEGADLAEWEVRELVRQSLARAGGADELAPLGGFLQVLPPGTGAGVATGPLIIALLAGLGVEVSQWRWHHGETEHPFPPHATLDGDLQTKPEDFSPYHPLDHKGCTCWLEPVLNVLTEVAP